MSRRARVVAFYLPQFHPIPENDAFWGEGFTEWTNVRRARPLFAGHEQPVEPGELGYYDLRDPGVRAAQAALAGEYGVEAFCWWHYWFAGRRVLERPFQEVLQTGEPGLSFCLGWANHSWTGVWQGAPGRLLIQQTYPGPADEAAHFQAVLPALRDERALRVDGRPVFVLFDPGALPDLRRFVAHWRALAAAAGLPGLYLVGLRCNVGPSWPDLDATVVLAPDHLMAGSSLRSTLATLGPGPTLRHLTARALGRRPTTPRIFSYDAALRDPWTPGPGQLPCVFPRWDNTPRAAGHGRVFVDSTPEGFARTVRRAVAQVAPRPADERLVFVKAWNEWAEGNMLEPCRRWGRGYLEALRGEVGGAA